MTWPQQQMSYFAPFRSPVPRPPHHRRIQASMLKPSGETSWWVDCVLSTPNMVVRHTTVLSLTLAG